MSRVPKTLPPLLVLVAAIAGPPPAAAEPAPAGELELSFSEGDGALTTVEGVLRVPADAVTVNRYGFQNVRLDGQVRTQGGIYDDFSLRFDVEAGGDEPLALAFQRRLRPGAYALLLEVADLNSGLRVEIKQPLRVPRVAPVDVQLEREEVASEAWIRLGPLPPIVIGEQEVTAVAGFRPDRVEFLIDGERVFARRAPPWSVQLDLGPTPELHELRVEAFDESGVLVASDSAELNTGTEPFVVRLVEPRPGGAHRGRLPVLTEVEVPRGQSFDRLEVYLGEERVALLREPPLRAQVEVADGELVVLRAVGYLHDGTTSEDAVLLNAPDQVARLDVDLVELYAAAVDPRGRPVKGLTKDDFRVLEDGVTQRIERFEDVEDLPIEVALVVDTSASMATRIGTVAEAATTFIDRVVGPEDRCMLVTVSTTPRLAVPLTGDARLLTNRLVGLEAEGRTALYDSVLFSLQRLPARGQRALVLISDGHDVSSRANEIEAVELARRMGVTLYAVGIVEPPATVDRPLLERLARESGGRSFFVSDAGQLGHVFEEIERELRSRYLIAYYSSQAVENGRFRRVDLEVDRPRLEARTILGYYP